MTSDDLPKEASSLFYIYCYVILAR